MSGQASLRFDRLCAFIRRRVPWVLVDAAVVEASLALSWAARSITADLDVRSAVLFSLLAVVVYCGINYLFRLYHRIWRYASAAEVVVIAGSVAGSTALLTVLDLVCQNPRPVPVSVVLLSGVFVLVGIVGVRYRSRLWTGFHRRWRSFLGRSPKGRTRVLIIGAGEVGQLLAWRFLHEKEGETYRLVGFVDDDPEKRGMRIHGVTVLGDRAAIPDLVARHAVDLIVVAIHNISGADFRTILDLCESTSAVIKVIPSVFDIIRGVNGQLPIRDVTPEDLLGRTPVHIDSGACLNLLANKTILVTGAAGSIGSELCRQIVAFSPWRLVMLDNNESGLFDTVESMQRTGAEAETSPDNSILSLAVESAGRTVYRPVRPLSASRAGSANNPACRLTPIIADVANEAKMRAVFVKYQPQVVFHAAAYKHVPLMEQHPDEAVRVNVLGTRIVATLSATYGVERFVLVSTDKAINPRSVMGATKRIGEMMIADGLASDSLQQVMKGERDGTLESPSTLFTAVRFGNVVGSRGSVIPLFERQIDRGGPVTVTHPEMTRYLMTIPEAVSLIIQAATMTQGGDIFMLDMGQRIRIDDLARRLIRLRGLRPDVDIPVVYTGVRPGEKMHEELLGYDEELAATAHPKIFRVRHRLNGDRFEVLRQVDELVELAETQADGTVVAKLWEIVGCGSRQVAPGKRGG